MSTNLIPYRFRASCRLCGSAQLRIFLKLNDIPLGEKYSDIPPQQEQRFPIDLYICEECCAVQTQTDINPDYLWSGYTYFSGNTPAIVRHFRQFIDFYNSQFRTRKNISVLEIGSNDGSLLELFQSEGDVCIGIDPSEEVCDVARKKHLSIIQDFFSRETAERFLRAGKNFDLICAFNVFAHSDNIPEMTEGISKLLSENGIFCFEVQYLQRVIDRKLVGTIFHEHMVHYSIHAIETLLRQYGMRCIDVQHNNVQMGSVIVVAAHEVSIHSVRPSVSSSLEAEKTKSFFSRNGSNELATYIKNQRQLAAEVCNKVDSSRLRLSGYGAARSGPTLLIQYGLDRHLSRIYDDHSSKVGRYTNFMGLEIRPTTELSRDDCDLICILAWVHIKPILRSLDSFMKAGGKVLALWPRIALIDSDNISEFLFELEETLK